MKKSLAQGISTLQIDDWYERAVKAGATGGKLLGAGGGGFLLFYAPKDTHSRLTKALPELRPFPFSFEKEGSRIIFVHS